MEIGAEGIKAAPSEEATEGRSQDRTSKIKALRAAFPKIDFANYIDDIASVDRWGHQVNIHFFGGGHVKADSEKKSVLHFGFAERAKQFARSLAEGVVWSFVNIEGEPEGRARNAGSPARFTPLTQEESERIAAAWFARGVQQISPTPIGVWIELGENTRMLDRGSEAFVYGKVSEDALAALMVKAKEDWNGRIELMGSDAFKLQAWEYAQAAGIVVIGYEPPADALVNGVKSAPGNRAPSPASAPTETSETTIDEINDNKPSNTMSVPSSNDDKRGLSSLKLAANEDSYDIEPFDDNDMSP